jgi:hypothetical protein
MENEAQPISPIEEARRVAKEVRDATAELRRVLDEAKQEQVKEILNGKAEAGQIPAPPAVETPAEYKNRVLSGKI